MSLFKLPVLSVLQKIFFYKKEEASWGALFLKEKTKFMLAKAYTSICVLKNALPATCFSFFFFLFSFFLTIQKSFSQEQKKT
jgi:hypothetical protein